MKIAVLSDIHDNIWNLEKVLARIKTEPIEALIYCGDYTAPSTFKKLAGFGLPLYSVFGNVDGAQHEITKSALNDYQNVTLEKDLLEIALDGREIAICHHPQFAKSLAATGDYDAVFYGHTHESAQEIINDTLLANPGEIHGGLDRCTFGIYDTKTNQIQVVEIK